MSNYPDGFNLDAYEFTMRQPEDVLPDDACSVYSAQEAYRECVRACVVILRKHGFTYLSKEDVSYLGFASSLEDMLEEYVKQELRNLEQEGFELNIRGDDHQRFFDEQYKFLKSKSTASVLTIGASL